MRLPDAETLKNLCAQLRCVFESHRDEAQRKSMEWRHEISSEAFDAVAGYNAEAQTWQQAAEIIDRAESAWTPCSRCKRLTAFTTEGGVCLTCVRHPR
jgi:hypothetical protein